MICIFIYIIYFFFKYHFINFFFLIKKFIFLGGSPHLIFNIKIPLSRPQNSRLLIIMFMSCKLVPALFVHFWLRQLLWLLLGVKGVPESYMVLNMFLTLILVDISPLSFFVNINKVNFLFLLYTCLGIRISIIWKISGFLYFSAAVFLLGRWLTLVVSLIYGS